MLDFLLAAFMYAAVALVVSVVLAALYFVFFAIVENDDLGGR